MSWVKRALVWLATHPWPIVAALGGILASVLFRRRVQYAAPAEIRTAELTGRADARREDAAKLEPAAKKLEASIDASEKELTRIQADPPKEEVQHASDREIADLFGRSGL